MMLSLPVVTTNHEFCTKTRLLANAGMEKLSRKAEGRDGSGKARRQEIRKENTEDGVL